MLVSFVLPAYKAKFFRQAVDSILAQDYSDIELVIVNDKSPENIEEIALSYSDPRIRYYKNEVNIGGKSLVEQWNYCISLAKGEYVVVAADDDIYEKSFCSECVKLARKYPDADLIRTSVAQINEDNEIIGMDNILPEYISKYKFLYYYLTATFFYCIGNYMFKTRVINEKKFFDYPHAYCTDLATPIMLSSNGCVSTDGMLFNFRISTINLSSSKKYLKDWQKSITMLYRYIMSLNYEKPVDKLDIYCHNVSKKFIHNRICADYYNAVIRNLPVYKFYWINSCELLSLKDKIRMFVKFIFRKFYKQPL